MYLCEVWSVQVLSSARRQLQTALALLSDPGGPSPAPPGIEGPPLGAPTVALVWRTLPVPRGGGARRCMMGCSHAPLLSRPRPPRPPDTSSHTPPAALQRAG
ncbi:unnamed protein product [Gadus morhua 'NCC']